MEIKEYNDPGAFLDENEKQLLEYETKSQLVLFSAYQCKKNEVFDKCSFGYVAKSGKPQLYYSHVPAYYLAIYMMPETEEYSSVITLADHFGNRDEKIESIVGEIKVCREFIEEYQRITSYGFIEILGMNLMELKELNEVVLADGIQRRALPEEASRVAQWMIDFQLETFTIEMDYQAARERAEKLVSENKVYFLERKESQVVSMAIAARRLPHSTTILYVFTPSQARGNGYAATNLYYLAKKLLEEGNQFCTLFVDKNNPLSAKAYEKVGFHIIDEIYEYKMIPV